MKQFLRYQLSGSVFLFWLVLFFYFSDYDKLEEIISKNGPLISAVLGVLFVYPVGAFLHQISVAIKNWIIAPCCLKSFDDCPKLELDFAKGNKNLDETDKFLFEKLSSINSFFYVRFDMGFVAPAFAYIVAFFVSGRLPKCDWVWVIPLLVWSAILLIYIPRLAKERGFILQALTYRAREEEDFKVTKSYKYHPLYFGMFCSIFILLMVCLSCFL